MARFTIGEAAVEVGDAEAAPDQAVNVASADEPATVQSAEPKSFPRTPKRTVCDPACGSGRMLLAVAEINPHW